MSSCRGTYFPLISVYLYLLYYIVLAKNKHNILGSNNNHQLTGFRFEGIEGKTDIVFAWVAAVR